MSPDSLLKEICKATESQRKREEKQVKELEYRRKLRSSYEFRREPVPYTNCSGYHRWNFYRVPKLGYVRRHSEDIEYAKYVKPKERRKNLPTWDDRPRHADRSWKSSYKVRKQWEKHLPKHVDQE